MKNKIASLIRKKRSRSAQAATVSIAFHVALLVLAGSTVAVRVIQKRNAEFTVSSAPPKLERRQLQMPEKMEQLRESTPRSKIVSRRASVTSPSFTAPDMGKLGKVSTQKFTMPFAKSGRDFSVLMRGIGTAAPQIKFFGIRAQGEKFIFIIDASPAMISGETGGIASFDYIKEHLMQTVGTLPSTVLFNVVLHDGETVNQFRTNMVPVTGKITDDLKEWLAPVNRDAAVLGLPEERHNYEPRMVYDSAMGEDLAGWILGLQAAFEQRPDTVFLVSPNWGTHGISKEKGELLLEFSLWEILGGGGQMSVAGSPLLRADRDMRDDLLKQAVKAITKREETQRTNKKPPDFMHNLLEHIQYSEKQVIGHAETVYRRNYLPRKLARPRVNFVRLVPERTAAVADADTTNIREFVRNYSGEAGVYRGQSEATARRLSSSTAAAAPAKAVDALPAPSELNLFGAQGKGRRIAFLLDASAEMIRANRGGTNAYAFIKSQIEKTAAALQPETKFNVFIYDKEKISMFRPEMTVAESAAELTEWFAPFNIDSALPGLTDEQNNYLPAKAYETALGDDVKGLPRAIQAAMEQQADAIYVVSTGIGRISVSPEKGRRLLNFSIWGTLGATATSGSTSVDTSTATDGGGTDEDGSGGESVSMAVVSSTSGSITSGGIVQPLTEDQKQRTAMIRAALARIGAENRIRQAAGAPAGFVHDILSYLDYTPDQVNAHITEVGSEYYISKEQDLPKIHTVCLAETQVRQGGRELGRDLRMLSESYRGNTRIFHGASKDDQILKLNRLIELK